MRRHKAEGTFAGKEDGQQTQMKRAKRIGGNKHKEKI
jgi:hypothetical protein